MLPLWHECGLESVSGLVGKLERCSIRGDMLCLYTKTPIPARTERYAGMEEGVKIL
jgi:hypothetical protein